MNETRSEVKKKNEEQLTLFSLGLKYHAEGEDALMVFSTEYLCEAFNLSSYIVRKTLSSLPGVYWIPFIGFFAGVGAKRVADAGNTRSLQYLKSFSWKYRHLKKQKKAGLRDFEHGISHTIEDSSIEKSLNKIGNLLKKKSLDFLDKIKIQENGQCQQKVRDFMVELHKDGLLAVDPRIIFAIDIAHSREIPVLKSPMLDLRRDRRGRRFTFMQRVRFAAKMGLAMLCGSFCGGRRKSRHRSTYSWKTHRAFHEKKMLTMLKAYVSPKMRKVLEFESLQPIIHDRIKRAVASEIRKASRYADKMRYNLREYFLWLHVKIYNLVPVLSKSLLSLKRENGSRRQKHRESGSRRGLCYGSKTW